MSNVGAAYRPVSYWIYSRRSAEARPATAYDFSNFPTFQLSRQFAFLVIPTLVFFLATGSPSDFSKTCVSFMIDSSLNALGWVGWYAFIVLVFFLMAVPKAALLHPFQSSPELQYHYFIQDMLRRSATEVVVLVITMRGCHACQAMTTMLNEFDESTEDAIPHTIRFLDIRNIPLSVREKLLVQSVPTTLYFHKANCRIVDVGVLSVDQFRSNLANARSEEVDSGANE